MGPNFWEPGGSDPIKKCAERVSNTCSDETDGCCGVIPCAYCIEWAPEEGDHAYAFADFATNGWAATIAGAAWFASWQRSYETGECEFVVTLNEVEIYRKSCYEGQSCRDSSDSAGATIAEVSGVITWTKYEPRPLEYIQDPDTNCTTYFCGDCDCTCECLCVVIADAEDNVIASGEICDVSYPCDGPVWSGTVGDYELSLSLGRDLYGDCIITPSVDGLEQDSVPAPGCAGLTASFVLGDGTTITVSCKQCACDETTPEDICSPCPPGTIYPWLVSITFPSLGVSELAGNELDPEEDGETTFLYRIEGTYGGYNFQCLFGECEASIAIWQDGPVGICSFSGTTGTGISMEAVDCPGDTLTLIYTITCASGSTLTVVISG